MNKKIEINYIITKINLIVFNLVIAKCNRKCKFLII